MPSPLTIDRELPQFSNDKFRDIVTSGSDALPADLIRISSLHHLESRDYDILGETPYFFFAPLHFQGVLFLPGLRAILATAASSRPQRL
jgi:hypothetical protein